MNLPLPGSTREEGQTGRPSRVAIACGGTGGHLFPGLAVAEELSRRQCVVTLLISPKEVDQQAVKTVSGLEVVTLPAVALTRRGFLGFVRGFWKSYWTARKLFRSRPPHAVLAMGGFTSAPPVLAGKFLGARTFLHESNTLPGRANPGVALAKCDAESATPTDVPFRTPDPPGDHWPGDSPPT